MLPVRPVIPGVCESARDVLTQWHCPTSPAELRELVERYLPFVYSSAFRRTGNAEDAAEVTRVVFLVLARRARRLGKKTVLPGWLFEVTTVASRKLRRKARRRQSDPTVTDETFWNSVGSKLDAKLHRLSTRHRNAVLLRVFLNQPWNTVATILRTSEQRAQRRVEAGLKKLARKLSTRTLLISTEALCSACLAQGCGSPISEEFAASLILSLEQPVRPVPKLAKRTLRALAWVRWRHRILIGMSASFLSVALVLGILWFADSRTGHSRSLSWIAMRWLRFEVWKVSRLIGPAHSWPQQGSKAVLLNAGAVRQAGDLYQTTNIWLAHLDFSLKQWDALKPHYIGPMQNFVRADGLWELRNPNAKRSGLAGVLGYEFDWTHADFDFGGLRFTNIATRAKGNMVSLCWMKRSFKLDLNKFEKGQKLGGLDELIFNSLVWDYSYLSDALAYEFFRDAGVPAPRTAYAWLSTSVEDRWVKKPFGLYLMLESVGDSFAAERFGAKNTPIFKPSTYELFTYLGENWSAYASIYSLKTKATAEEKQRVLDFAHLVSRATDHEFASLASDFLDFDEFARFLAVEVLLSHYDGILLDGQNFYMYLDPGSKKLGFIPWDLDSAWGDFWIGTKPELEKASIWHPWVGKNRFLERVMAVPEFRRIYRSHLEQLISGLFRPARLEKRIDEIAAIIREPIAAESPFHLAKFEQSLSKNSVHLLPGESIQGINHPAHQLKKFIEARHKSVRKQLEGSSSGIILKTPAEKKRS